MSSNLTELFIVDDTDPRLLWNGPWFTGGGPQEHQHSTHGASAPGASVTFMFNGTFVSASGTITSAGVNYSYSLDRKQPTFVTLRGTSPPAYNFSLLSVPDLAYGEHNLTISSQSREQTLWIDYLSYTGTPLPDISPASSSTTSSPSKHRIPPGVIVAIVLGTVVGLLLLVLLSNFVSRRWHRVRLTKPQQDTSVKEKGLVDLGPPVIEPSPRPSFADVIRMKMATPPRMPAPTSHTTTVSSSLFSSVIFAYSGSGGSSSGPRSARSAYSFGR